MSEARSTSRSSRPLRSAYVPELRQRVKTIRHELSKRSTRRARRLRAEIDPDYAANVKRDCCVYVIELDDDVRTERRFKKQNEECEMVRGCLYVGSTSKAPGKRFREHKAGKQASPGPRDYGVSLRPEFTVGLSGLTRDEAETYERKLSVRLRRAGYGVWQG